MGVKITQCSFKTQRMGLGGVEVEKKKDHITMCAWESLAEDI